MLNKTDIHNLLIFLRRSTLNGEEVPAYISLVDKLQKMKNACSQECETYENSNSTESRI